MRVRNWMTRDVQTIQAEDRAEDAWRLIMSRQIRQLPVLSGGDVVGVISRGDLLRSFQNLHDEEPVNTAKVKEVMTPDPMAVSPEMPFEEATSKMYRARVGSLLVLNQEGELVGILTRSDLFSAIMEITGMKESVQRKEFSDTNLENGLAKLRDRPENIYAKSFLAFRHKDVEEWTCLVRFAERKHS